MANFNLLTDIQYIFYHIAQLYYNLASQHCLTHIIDQNCRLCHRLDNRSFPQFVMLCYFSVSSSQIIYFPSSGKYSLARSFSRVLTSVLFQSFWRVYLVAWVITLFSTSLLFHLTSYFCLISILMESSIWLLCDHRDQN